ncbi:sulfate/molybdate ABC transporter ATP-binding protein [Sporolactobacillus putidus]|uniref:Sulfate/thiosulfate import ATP-binding protein CysA n=1 Tax=Sporolactobacillus putidus TaxID=492735 RepID=A0A917S124_9BACL|nr:TOBE-like domain-containing protein [Sporolactobacillus putidus]GGL47457.1 sulfate/thiosulfate import ATP-binding protein CysA [Sporolactobacillus putidus]
MSIEINHVSKSYGSFQILKNINFTIQTGELIALLGPSGSGKTSLLRIVAGLEQADEGQIVFNGQDLTNARIKDRKVGFVFQHYALFQNMTVFHNIAYGLNVLPRKYRPSKKEIKEKVEKLLSLIRLEPYGKRYPSQLSGGQRQRVALARALAIEPKILLLDEPFGALDAKVRKELRDWLRHLHESVGITSIFVTHDQEEAFEVADRVVIMHDGKIEQIGTPEHVYDHPANPFIYDFIGSANRFEGKIAGGKFVDGDFETDAPEYPGEVTQGLGFVRPYHFIIEKQKSGNQSLKAKIKHVQPVGPIVRLNLERSDTHDLLHVEMNREEFSRLDLHADELVHLKVKKVQIFSTGQ